MKNFIQNISITQQVAEQVSMIKCPDLFMPLVRIESGSFLRGADNAHPCSSPEHRVIITRQFWMCKQEVTQTEYMEVMGRNPSYNIGAALPVNSVTWFEAVEFCRRITERARSSGCITNELIFRLPTEAEWEYACRTSPEEKDTDSDAENLKAGPAYCFGSNPQELANYAWFQANSEERAHPVGTKSASSRGLYDLHGNMAEWCCDWFAPYSNLPQTNPLGPSQGEEKVLRGGSWAAAASRCCSYDRVGVNPDTRSGLIGFRVVLAEK